jgi:uncharacterized protein
MSPLELLSRELADLPIFPLPEGALFPGAALPLHVFEPRYRELVRHVLAGQKMMAVARLAPGFESNYGGRPAVLPVCGAGVIEAFTERKDGRFDITLRGLARVRILEELPPLRAFRQVRAELLPDVASKAPLVAAWQTQLTALWGRLAPHLPTQVRDLKALTRGADEAGAYADRLAAALVADPTAAQELVEELDPAERLRMLTGRVQELLDALAPGSRRDGALN